MVFDGNERRQLAVNGHGDHTLALFGTFRNIGQTRIIFGNDIFGRAQQHFSAVMVDDARAFCCTGKGNEFLIDRIFLLAEIAENSVRGSVAVFCDRHDHPCVGFHFFHRDKRFHFRHRHCTVCERACFIQTDHIHPRQVFKRIQFLHQRLFFRQRGDRHHHGNGGRQHQTRRDDAAAEHSACQNNPCPCDRIAERKRHAVPQSSVCAVHGDLIDHRHNDHNSCDHDADCQQLDDLHDRGHQLGFMLRTAFHFSCQFCGIGIIADLFGSAPCRTDNDG